MLTSDESNRKQAKYSIYFDDYINKTQVEKISKTLKKEVIPT